MCPCIWVLRPLWHENNSAGCPQSFAMSCQRKKHDHKRSRVTSPGSDVVGMRVEASMSDLLLSPAGAVLDADAAQRVVRQFGRLLSSLRAARRSLAVPGASSEQEREAQKQPADGSDEAAAGRELHSAAVDSHGAAPAPASVGSPGSRTGHAEEWSSADAWGAAEEEEPCAGRAGGGDGPQDEEVAAEPGSERQRRSGALGRAAEQLFPGGRDGGVLGALVAAAYPDRAAQRRERGNRRGACWTCMSTHCISSLMGAAGRLVAAAYPNRMARLMGCKLFLNKLLWNAGLHM